ncbi:MAG: DUF4349 domain-containing protein [Fimbriimonadales bacterium]
MARQILIILLVVAVCAIIAAVFFPVFAQSKSAAKRTAALSEYKQRAIAAEIKADDAKATLASYTQQARAVIRKAQLTVMVESLDRAETGVKDIVAHVGGYIENTEGWDLASPTPSLKISGRIPQQSFDATLAQFEKLGQRTAKTISTDDVTEQIVDMDARLKTMLAQEDVYRGMLRQVKSVRDAIQMQEQLMKLREEIESMAAQRKSLAGQAEMSSIEVTLDQKANPLVAASVDPNWGGDAWNGAVSAAATTFRGIGVMAIWLAVFSPLWLAPCLIVFAVYRVRKRDRMKETEVKA